MGEKKKGRERTQYREKREARTKDNDRTSAIRSIKKKAIHSCINQQCRLGVEGE
jgi:hypothetical protein